MEPAQAYELRLRSRPWSRHEASRGLEKHLVVMNGDGCDPVRDPGALQYEHRCGSICLLVGTMAVMRVQPRDAAQGLESADFGSEICHISNEILWRYGTRGMSPLWNQCRCTWAESGCHLIASDNLQRVRVLTTEAVHVLVSNTSKCSCAVVVHENLATWADSTIYLIGVSSQTGSLMFPSACAHMGDLYPMDAPVHGTHATFFMQCTVDYDIMRLST